MLSLMRAGLVFVSSSLFSRASFSIAISLTPLGKLAALAFGEVLTVGSDICRGSLIGLIGSGGSL